MKKLIMLGVAICAACAVQAAGFLWAATTVNGTDGSGNVLTSSGDAATFVLAYLGTSDSYSYDSAVAVQTGSWSITSTKKSGNTAKVSGTYDGSSSANGGSFANGQVYAVMVQTDDGLVKMDPAAPVYTVSGYSGDAWSGDAYQFASAAYKADKASYGGGGGAPEPTSGLLLLVGGAMLALRRKQK